MNNIITLTKKDIIELNLDTRTEYPEEGVYAVDGIYCYKEKNEWVPDCSFSVFYRIGETDPDKFICYEQDEQDVAFHNMKSYIREFINNHDRDRAA